MKALARRSAWIAILVALASILAVACTTELGDFDEASLGRSTILGISDAQVVRILERDGTVVWFDGNAGVYSCPTTGCDSNPAVVTRASGVFATTYGAAHVLPATVATANGRFNTCVGHVCAACDGDYGSGSPSACPAEQPTCKSGTCAVCSPFDCGSSMRCGALGCSASCATTADCDATHFCSAMLCVPRRAFGASCTDPTECAANACTAGQCGKAASDSCTKDDECRSGVCAADMKCGALDGSVRGHGRAVSERDLHRARVRQRHASVRFVSRDCAEHRSRGRAPVLLRGGLRHEGPELDRLV